MKTLDGCKETTEPDEDWYPGKLISKHFHRKGLFFKCLIGKGTSVLYIRTNSIFHHLLLRYHQDLEEEPNADLDASSFDQEFINQSEDNLVEVVETFRQEDAAKVSNRFLFLETSSSYDLIK